MKVLEGFKFYIFYWRGKNFLGLLYINIGEKK